MNLCLSRCFRFFRGKQSSALLIALLLFVSSCNNRFDQDEGLTVFRYNEPGNVTSLDPVYARNQANIWAVSQLFNSLVELDSQLQVKPALAREWKICDEGLTYTFYLRQGVRFHDNACFLHGSGRLLTAHDFVFSLNRLVEPSLNSPGSWVMNQVARRSDGSLDIFASNDSVLVITLSKPFPPFPGLLGMAYCSAVPHEAIEKYGTGFRRNPVGTGPFRFQYWKEGVKLVFRKNEHYFEHDQGIQLPYLDAVSISFIIDRQTAFLEFMKGNIDFLSGVDASYKDELLTPDGKLQPKYHDRFELIAMPFLNTEYLGMMVNETNLPDKWPLLDVKVRRAINYGFDRSKMLAFLRNNIGIPAYGGFVPVGVPGFSENEGGYHYDQDYARKLLSEAGFPEGNGLPVITLMTNQTYQDIAQFIQHELSRIGIRIAIDVMPPATLREAMAKGEAGFFRASWIADYPDAENFLALFYSGNKSPTGPNYTHFSDMTFDSLYIQSLSVTNENLRYDLYRQMNDIIIEQAPVVFLFYDQSVRFVSATVKGMTNNPLNHLDLRRVKNEE
jgi:ABC-type transport system substrate-binding protein